MLRVWIRRILKVSIPLVLGLILCIWYCNNWIDKACDDYIFSTVEEIPRTQVGLLLGTSKYNRSGNPNQFFRYRIDAAVKLYFNRKVKYLLVSGDNRTLNYNEPRDMRRALIARGVPDSMIILDYAGIRTFDSVIRCNRVFGQSSFTIISQEFHLSKRRYQNQPRLQKHRCIIRKMSGPQSKGATQACTCVFCGSACFMQVCFHCGF